MKEVSLCKEMWIFQTLFYFECAKTKTSLSHQFMKIHALKKLLCHKDEILHLYFSPSKLCNITKKSIVQNHCFHLIVFLSDGKLN